MINPTSTTATTLPVLTRGDAVSNAADSQPTLQDLADKIDALTQGLEQSRQEFKDEVTRWDERFFQFTRENLITARTIIITAGTVIILSPLLQAFAPAIQAVVSRLVAGDSSQ